MPLFLVCTAGHRWSVPELPASSEPSGVCPTCGGAGVSHVQEDASTSGDASNPSSITAPSCGTQHLFAPVVPGYEFLAVLGTGAMAIVFQALQLQHNRLVALKMILPGKDSSLTERKRFLTESEAVARLDHPNIVRIYQSGEYEGNIYLALEYVNGGNLARRIAGQCQPCQPSARLVEQLARATHSAHQCGIIHRDLKPGNILLQVPGALPDDLGIPKIADFGLAKRLEVVSELTRTGQVLGTPNYMPPEQAAGLSKRLGPAADIYALGAILYHLLTGKPPFKSDSTLETLRLIQVQPPVPPRTHNSGVPHDLEAICLTCLEKDPARRYPSALDLADDLRRFLEGRPVQAQPAPATEGLCP